MPRAAVPEALVTEASKFPGGSEPTVAKIVVGETTEKLVAGTFPKLTAVVLLKLVPLIVTEVPVPPWVGVNEVIVGALLKIKPERFETPYAVVTVTSPADPVSTTARIVVEDCTMNEETGALPKLICDVVLKLFPEMVTTVPFPPVAGANELIEGLGTRFLKMEKAVPDPLPEMISGLASLSRSVSKTVNGIDAALKSVLLLKEIVPG